MGSVPNCQKEIVNCYGLHLNHLKTKKLLIIIIIIYLLLTICMSHHKRNMIATELETINIYWY